MFRKERPELKTMKELVTVLEKLLPKLDRIFYALLGAVGLNALTGLIEPENSPPSPQIIYTEMDSTDEYSLRKLSKTVFRRSIPHSAE